MPFSRSISPQSTRRSQRLFIIFFLGVLPPGRRHRHYGFRLVEPRAYSSERPEAANSAVNYYFLFRFDRSFFWPAARLKPDTYTLPLLSGYSSLVTCYLLLITYYLLLITYYLLLITCYSIPSKNMAFNHPGVKALIIRIDTKILSPYAFDF
jgi:hypothetical protein